MKQAFIHFILSHKKYFVLFPVVTPVMLFIFLSITQVVLASFGSWGSTSLIHACRDDRGRVILVDPGDSCNAHEDQVTWLKDVNAGDGLTITRSSSGATLALADDIATGWTPTNQTWTYDSSTTFTVPGDVTAQFQKGTRVKFTQTTVKYGVVKLSTYSGGTTTVLLFGNNDYSIANTSITSPFYSYQASPQGYPEWFAYSPVIDGTSGSAGSFSTLNLTGYFSVLGSKLTYAVEATVNNKGSWSGDIRAGIPATANIGQGTFYYLWGMVSNDGDAANAIKAHNVSLGNGQSYLVFEKTFGSLFIQWSDVTAPFRIASHGDVRY